MLLVVFMIIISTISFVWKRIFFKKFILFYRNWCISIIFFFIFLL